MEEMLCQAPDLEPEMRWSCDGIEDRNCQAPDRAPDIAPETCWLSHTMQFYRRLGRCQAPDLAPDRAPDFIDC